jgi:hypothetical protein
LLTFIWTKFQWKSEIKFNSIFAKENDDKTIDTILTKFCSDNLEVKFAFLTFCLQSKSVNRSKISIDSSNNYILSRKYFLKVI